MKALRPAASRLGLRSSTARRSKPLRKTDQSSGQGRGCLRGSRRLSRIQSVCIATGCLHANVLIDCFAAPTIDLCIGYKLCRYRSTHRFAQCWILECPLLGQYCLQK
jgi:hypothetical protein